MSVFFYLNRQYFKVVELPELYHKEHSWIGYIFMHYVYGYVYPRKEIFVEAVTEIKSQSETGSIGQFVHVVCDGFLIRSH